MNPSLTGALRHDWTLPEVVALFQAPFADLVFHAQRVHRSRHEPNTVQMSTLLSIKTGACPEDCAYCPQSLRYDTGIEREALMDLSAVREAAARARDAGATRFCMGAAYRSPKNKDLKLIIDMIRAVRALGLETCATLGMLSPDQASELAHAGLDFYNHNLDTSREFYPQIISTRSYQDRLDTLSAVRAAGLKVCCGGIIGMGEQAADRVAMLVTLANLPEPPESVPINSLMPIAGTPLADAEAVGSVEFVRTIALARILMPRSLVRLSAGRTAMSDEMQALCFFAGANSIFVGDRLLTAGNPSEDKDAALFRRLGIVPMGLPEA